MIRSGALSLLLPLLLHVALLWVGPRMQVLAAEMPVPANKASDATEAEIKKLQGNWQQVRAVLDGQQTAEDIAKQFEYRFQGTRFTNSRKGKIISEGTYSVDPAKKPPQMNLVEKDGTKLFAIYSLDADKLTICFHEDSPPKTLESKKGQRRFLVTLERHKR